MKAYGNISYTYDAGGIRQSKTANGVTTQYCTEGSTIHKEVRGNEEILYFYGKSGIAGMVYNGEMFYYVKNLQGDVIGILADDGQNYYGDWVAQYAYDAWGNCTVTYDPYGIGALNPFRYRGYYWDSETGLYYLQSRYYDPQIGRFINADNTKYLDPQTLNGLNLYAYCLDNPVNNSDPTGKFILSIFLACLIIGTVLGIATSTVNAVKDGKTGWELVGAIALGALTGAALGAAVGLVAGAGGAYLVGALLSVGGKLVEDLSAYSIYGTPIGTWEDYAVAFVFGGLNPIYAGSPQGFMLDVFVRPGVNQLVRMGTGRQKEFNAEKYQYDIVTRAATYFMPGRSFARGITRGYWDQMQNGGTNFLWSLA